MMAIQQSRLKRGRELPWIERKREEMRVPTSEPIFCNASERPKLNTKRPIAAKATPKKSCEMTISIKITKVLQTENMSQ